MPFPVGIVGFSGYSGAEAVRILSRHPHCEPVLLEHRPAGDQSSRIRRPGPRRAPATPETVAEQGITAVLLATPADISMDLAPKFLDAGAIVVDLSGAFRLGTAECYRHWYREEHTAPALLSAAVYGLPEYNR